MSYPLAIQSWCFKHFTALPDFFAKLKEAGVGATEVCGVHANFNDPSTHAAMLTKFKAADVQITSIGVETLTGDIEKDRPRFEFCKAAGVKVMSISFKPDAMFAGVKNMETLADEYDLKLGIHNHGSYDWLGNETMLKHVFANTTRRIGLHLDTAWALDASQDPLKLIELFGDRLTGVHVKDFIFDRAGKPEDVVVGTGNLDLPKLMKALKTVNFNGPLVIEYEGNFENPVPALKDCIAAINAAR